MEGNLRNIASIRMLNEEIMQRKKQVKVGKTNGLG